MMIWTTAYTDASHMPTSNSTAYAFWAKSEFGRIKEADRCPKWVRDSVSAEAYAVFMAIDRTLRDWPQVGGILVVSDCEAAIRTAWPWSKPPKNKTLDRIRVLIGELEGKICIRTRHVKGHQNNKSVSAWLNNWCDAQARAHARKEKFR